MLRMVGLVFVIACDPAIVILESDAPPRDIDDRTPPRDGPSLTDCEEAHAHSDFPWIEGVLARNCASVGCHAGANPAVELRLEVGLARENLVGRPSTTYPDWTRVTPGALDASYLLVALGRAAGPVPRDGFMPLGAPQLCIEVIEAIERWIHEGAQ